MQKVKNLFLNKILKKKRYWISILVVLIIVVPIILNYGNNSKNVTTDIAKKVDLKETVLATGQVVSNTDINLSFNTNGVVKSVNVKVGEKVKQGQTLAALEGASEYASLTSARGVLAAARARYKKILEGASSEEVRLSEILLEQTKLTQNVSVKSAYEKLLNSTPEAVPEDESDNYTAPTISGTYSLGKEGRIYLKMYYSAGGVSYTLSGLTSGTGLASSVTPQPIGNSGLYITFPTDINSNMTTWVIDIPNKKAANYLTNYSAYENAVAQASAAIDQKQAELDIKKAKARQSDIDLANADIISAEGQVRQAEVRYNDTMIKSPADGTITSVDVKVGELAQAQKESFVLQDVSNIYLEANINEANINSLSVGMPVDITFDAFGTDKIFRGNITKIDPSSTIISGVVNYKITTSVEQSAELRPGMTANMTINVKEKKNVLVAPSRAILISDNGDKTIRLITNTKKKKYREVLVKTGMEGDSGMIEITSGLKEGDEYVVLVKNK